MLNFIIGFLSCLFLFLVLYIINFIQEIKKSNFLEKKWKLEDKEREKNEKKS